MTDSPVVCPVCHGDGFIVEEYRRFADGGAYIESFDTDCPKCRKEIKITTPYIYESRRRDV